MKPNMDFSGPITRLPVMQGAELPRPFISIPTTTTVQQPTGLLAFFEQPTETKTTIRNLGGTATTTTTITPLPSGYETFEKGVSEKYVKPFTPELSKESFIAAAVITLPMATIPGGIASEGLSFLTGKKQVSPAETLGSFYYGQYQGVREKPVQTVAAVGVGAVLGAGFKALEVGGGIGAEAAGTQFPRATAALTTLNVNYLPKVIAGVYAADVGVRSTAGLTDFEPTRVSQRFGGIMSTETVPMGIGFGIGHEAPGAVYRGARMEQINYLSAVQEGRATGVADYYGQKVMRPVEMAKIDYASFVQEGRGGLGEYAKYKVQKPIMETEFKVSLFFEKMGRPDLSAAPKEAPTRPSQFFTPEQPGRIGTKVVGGKTVGGLKPEPSLKSMGVFEEVPKGAAEKTYGGKIGKPSETMKPWDISKSGGKQSAISLSVMSEQLPGMEPMQAPGRMPAQQSYGFAPMQVPRARAQVEEMFTAPAQRQRFLMEQPSFLIPQQRTRQRQELVQVIQPEFQQTQKKGLGVMFSQEFAQTSRQKQREAQAMMMSQEVMQGQRSQQVQRQRTEFSFDQTSRSAQRQRERIITDQFQESRRETRQRTDLITIPRQETGQKKTTEQINKITRLEDKIITPGGFTLPSGTDTGRQRGRSKSPFRETINIRSMFAEATKIKKRRKS
jgi:hypothetical protein